MGTIIHAFKKCCPPSPEASESAYPRRSFSINTKKTEEELYEVVDVPEWGRDSPTERFYTGSIFPVSNQL